MRLYYVHNASVMNIIIKSQIVIFIVIQLFSMECESKYVIFIMKNAK